MNTAPVKPKDAVALLKADHKKVKELFDQFEKAKDARTKEKIVKEALQELKVHTTIEEEIFYPTVRAALKKDEDQDLLDEAEEEHRVAKSIVEALETMSAGDENYDAKFTVLAENVRHHIKEEEGDLFPDAKKADLDFTELGGQMQARKDALMASKEELATAVASSEVKPYQELA